MTARLTQHIAEKHATLCEFAQQLWVADASGALFWPQQQWLIISDCHFEKGSFLKQFANPIPVVDTQTTLQVIAKLIDIYEPKRVVCLGDSFHDVHADKRLLSADIHTLQQLIASVPQWDWVLGNHDPDIPRHFLGARVPYLIKNKILFTHEPEGESSLSEISAQHCQPIQYQIIGHYHPKLYKTIRRHKMSGKCFLFDSQNMIMPAIGTFTGGLDVNDPAFDPWVDSTSHQYVLCYQDKAYRLV
jgi:uncharacterized protein